ncbi:MAG: hypothetical protein ABFE07_23525 [Armatimonadia bacterium]
MLILNKEDFDELRKRANETGNFLDFIADLSAIRVEVDNVGILQRGEVMDNEHPSWGIMTLAEWGKRIAEWDTRRMDALLSAWKKLDATLKGEQTS